MVSPIAAVVYGCAFFVHAARFAVFVIAHEHGVVIFRVLIEQRVVGKVINHITLNAPLFDKILLTLCYRLIEGIGF